MKSLFLQVLLVGALAGIAATVSNVMASGKSEKFLDWWPSGRYPDATKVRGCAPGEAPTPPVSAAPEAPTPPVSAAPAPEATPVGAPKPAKSDTPAADQPFAHLQFPETLEQLRAGATFVDARRSKEYLDGHISGAYSVPAWESPDQKINALLADGAVVVEAPAVVYCSSSKDCEDSLIVGRLLEAAGFTEVTIYKGGFPEWQHKLPAHVAKGSEPGEVDYDALPQEAP